LLHAAVLHEFVLNRGQKHGFRPLVDSCACEFRMVSVCFHLPSLFGAFLRLLRFSHQQQLLGCLSTAWRWPFGLAAFLGSLQCS